MKVKYNVDAPNLRQRGYGKWGMLYDIVDNMEINEWSQIEIDKNIADKNLRAAVSYVGKVMGFKLRVHKIEQGKYNLGKFEKGE